MMSHATGNGGQRRNVSRSTDVAAPVRAELNTVSRHFDLGDGDHFDADVHLAVTPRLTLIFSWVVGSNAAPVPPSTTVIV